MHRSVQVTGGAVWKFIAGNTGPAVALSNFIGLMIVTAVADILSVRASVAGLAGIGVIAAVLGGEAVSD